MTIVDAIARTGGIPSDSTSREQKKRYSERLSQHLAVETATGLRNLGFRNIRPEPGGPGEREFQGGLGPKKVDVSLSDERNGLLMAISVKSINFAPFGKNLKNRFSDLCTEAITLHLRFPYAIVCALFAFPASADQDMTSGRTTSTFARAMKLLATIDGRREYTDPGEKFEQISMLLFEPADGGGKLGAARLFNVESGKGMTENEYFSVLRDLYNTRNPNVPVGDVEYGP